MDARLRGKGRLSASVGYFVKSLTATTSGPGPEREDGVGDARHKTDNPVWMVGELYTAAKLVGEDAARESWSAGEEQESEAQEAFHAVAIS